MKICVKSKGKITEKAIQMLEIKIAAKNPAKRLEDIMYENLSMNQNKIENVVMWGPSFLFFISPFILRVAF